MTMHDLHHRLKMRFPVEELTAQRPNLAFVSVPADALFAVLQHLRDHEGYSHLVLLTAVDWLEENQFQLTYLLCNRAQNRDIGVRVRIDRPAIGLATMHSIHPLWATAATYQRELREMFGIDFPGSPRVDEDFILEGWIDIPPYRRDFDTLEFSKQNFAQRPGRETHDPTRHMQQQLYPDSGA